MTTLDNLLNDIFDGKQSAFYAEFEMWARESRRFRTFATYYRSKIRAKLKNVRDEAGLKDVRAELETAALLLREERFTLEYEKYAAVKQRGPDFTVTFKTHTLFNIEVRRFRSDELAGSDKEMYIAKLMAVLWDKVRQMPPSSTNMLWLIADYATAEDDLSQAALKLRQLAEQKQEDFFVRHGFKNAADFLKQYRLLSGVILHKANGNAVWLNTIARHSTSPEITRALQRL